MICCFKGFSNQYLSEEREQKEATMLRQKSALAFFNVVAIRQIFPQQGAKSRKLGCIGKN
jgi:hypothetical protein